MISPIVHLQMQQQVLIMAIPPPEAALPAIFLPQHADILRRLVDGFSVMTYDASRGYPGPNAPQDWVSGAISRLLRPSMSRYMHVHMGSLEGLVARPGPDPAYALSLTDETTFLPYVIGRAVQ